MGNVAQIFCILQQWGRELASGLAWLRPKAVLHGHAPEVAMQQDALGSACREFAHRFFRSLHRLAVPCRALRRAWARAGGMQVAPVIPARAFSRWMFCLSFDGATSSLAT